MKIIMKDLDKQLWTQGRNCYSLETRIKIEKRRKEMKQGKVKKLSVYYPLIYCQPTNEKRMKA
jgi:hypothetical protein